MADDQDDVLSRINSYGGTAVAEEEDDPVLAKIKKYGKAPASPAEKIAPITPFQSAQPSLQSPASTTAIPEEPDLGQPKNAPPPPHMVRGLFGEPELPTSVQEPLDKARKAQEKAGTEKALQESEEELHPTREAFLGKGTFFGSNTDLWNKPLVDASKAIPPSFTKDDDLATNPVKIALLAQGVDPTKVGIFSKHLLQAASGFLTPKNIATVGVLSGVNGIIGALTGRSAALLEMSKAAVAAGEFEKAEQAADLARKIGLVNNGLRAGSFGTGAVFTAEFGKDAIQDATRLAKAAHAGDWDEAAGALGDLLPNGLFAAAGGKELFEAGERVKTGIAERAEARRTARADVGLAGQVQPSAPEVVAPGEVPEDLKSAMPTEPPGKPAEAAAEPEAKSETPKPKRERKAKAAPAVPEEPPTEAVAPKPEAEAPQEPPAAAEAPTDEVERRVADGESPTGAERRRIEDIQGPPSTAVLKDVNERLAEPDLTDFERETLEARRASLEENPEDVEALRGQEFSKIREEKKGISEYAKNLVSDSDVKEVSLVGSTAEKGAGRDVDLLYDFGNVGLPGKTSEAEGHIESLLEKQKGIDLDSYDTFVKADGRYFHVSSGAGRGVVENTEYGKQQAGRPIKSLAKSESEGLPTEPEAGAKFTPPGDVIKLRGGIRRRSMLSQLPLTDKEEVPTEPPGTLMEKAPPGGFAEADKVPKTPEAEAKRRAEHIAALPKPSNLKEGDRVRWASTNGKQFTGTIRNIDPEEGTASIDTDQIQRIGGRIPIGRVEIVRMERLLPETLDTEEGEGSTLPVEEEGHEQPTEPGSEPTPIEEPNEQQPVGEPGERALEEVPPEDVRGTSEGRAPATEGGGGGGTDRERLAPDGERGRSGLPERVGGGEGAVSVSPEREGSTGSVRPQFGAGERSGNDYRITDADKIGAGGERTKYRANIAAIRTLKAIELEGRQATPAEQAVLVKYVGWGGIASNQLFNPETKSWAEEYKELQGLLSPEEYRRARASTLNAHYTSLPVVRAMWDALQRLGFRDGRVLEPSAGIGHFLGAEPGELANASRRTAVEIDSISGRILKQLYQNADVRIQSFGDFRTPNDTFDVAIGNVPFGKLLVHDPAYNKYNLSIHNYFILKTLDKLRPGGIAALITSHHTLDAFDPKHLKLFQERADLVGAIRLPNTAFKGNAGTEVTTDILFLKKRAEDAKVGGDPFLKQADFKTLQGNTMPINEYFVKHPEMMLGNMELAGTMRRANEPALIPKEGQELAPALAEAIAKLPKNVLEERKVPDSATMEASAASIPDFKELKQYGLAVKNGKVFRRIGDATEQLNDYPKASIRTLDDMLKVRDAARELLKAEGDDRPQNELAELRGRLNRIYDRFVEKNGIVHQARNEKAMHADPDLAFLLSLENYDRETKQATKATMFKRRVRNAMRTVTKADNAKDAMFISLAEKGILNFDYMAQLTGKPKEDLQTDLKSQGLVFQDPDGHWETSDMYLSGNVRKKYEAALAASRDDESFTANAEALKNIIPKDIPPSQIYLRLGSSWLPTNVVEDFIRDLLGSSGGRYLKVTHNVNDASWEVDYPYDINPVSNKTTWGTTRAPATWLISQGLNQRATVVWDTDSNNKKSINQKETTAAGAKLDAINEELKRWLFEHPEHGPKMARTYNDLFNSNVEWKPDGSHLTLPGSSPEIIPRFFQKNGIWRAIAGKNNTLLSWEVGLGKSYTLIGIAMEWRRLGLKKKPMLVVPTHLVEQFREDFLRMYPMANVLAADQDSFKTLNRKEFIYRIATGDWDSIVVGDSQFGRIPAGATATEMALEKTLQEARANYEQAVRSGAGYRTVKELEAEVANIEAQVQKLEAKEKKDDVMTFPELGVDGLLIDEAHRMKSLYFPTKQGRLRGVPRTKSQRAMDTYIKTRYITKVNNGNGVVFSTGTPITNTIAEAWILAKYLDEPQLEASGMAHFDGWAANFGQAVSQAEGYPEDPTKLRMVVRFNKFNNIPEATSFFRRTADIKYADDVGLERPKMVGGAMEPFKVAPSNALLDFIKTLVERAKSARGRRPEKGADNMLVITSDGRKAAIDMRMVDDHAEDDPDSKLNQASREVARIYHDTRDQRLTQVIGLDLREGIGGFDAYQDLRKKMIKLGIPKDQIAFIQDYKSSAAKQGLFNRMNEGKISVLMGSSETLGIGVNVQKRLLAMHRIDPPWRPDQVEQFNGRGIRWGNMNKEVLIRNYVTKKSFDAYMWHILNVKNEFRNQFLRGNPDVRTIEDVSGRALNAAEMEAAAADDPRLFRKMEVESNIARLESLARSFKDQQFDNRFRLARLPEEIEGVKKKLDATKKDADLRDSRPKDFGMTIGKKHYDDRKEAGAALNAIIQSHEGQPKKIGDYGGFDIYVDERNRGYLMGKRSWDFKMGKGEANEKGEIEPSPMGTIQSIEGSLRGIDNDAKYLQEREGNLEKESKERKAKLDEKFGKQDDLDKAKKELAELNEALGLNKAENVDSEVSLPDPEEEEEDEDDDDGGTTMSFMGVQNAYNAIRRIIRKWKRSRAAQNAKVPEEEETPPRGIPEEPPGAESKAAKPGEKAINIRLDKLNSPEDVIDLIRQIAKSNAGRIHFQRRGKLSDAQLKKRMDEVGLDAEKLSKLPKGKTLNEAEIEVAIGIMQSEGDKVLEAARSVQKSNSDENILKAQELHSRYVAIQAAVSGITAEAGRALRTFRRIHEALERDESSNYEKVIDALGGRKLTEEEAKKLLQIPEGDRKGFYKFLRDHQKIEGFKQQAVSFLQTLWKTDVLSSPRTFVRKSLGDAISTTLQLAKIGIRPAIDPLLAKMTRRPREYFVQDALAQYAGYGPGFMDGIKKAAYIMKNGYDLEDEESFNLGRKELPGGLATNFPTRGLAATTRFFQTAHYHAVLAGLATRNALRSGLRGQEAKTMAADLYDNPTPEMVKEAQEESETLALIERPDSVLRAVNNLIKTKIPERVPIVGGAQPLEFVVPFRNIAWNLLKQGVRYSPAGAERIFEKGNLKNPKSTDYLAEALIGSAILLGMIEYAMQGNITGPAPKGAAERDAFYRAGKQPLSIKVGDRWVGYPGAVAILTPALAAVAGWHDAYVENGKHPSRKQVIPVFAAIGAAAADEPLLSGVQSLNEALTDPHGVAAEKLISGIVSGFIPGSSLLRTTAGSVDPAVRDAEGVYERIKAGLPFASKTLPQRVDFLGRGETHRGAEGAKAFLPSAVPEAEPLSDVDAELGRLQDLGMNEISPVENSITVQNVKEPLTRSEKAEYQTLRGTLLREYLAELFADPDYQALEDEQKIKETKSLVRKIEDAAREEMIRRIMEEYDKSQKGAEQTAVPMEP